MKGMLLALVVGIVVGAIGADLVMEEQAVQARCPFMFKSCEYLGVRLGVGTNINPPSK